MTGIGAVQSLRELDCGWIADRIYISLIPGRRLGLEVALAVAVAVLMPDRVLLVLIRIWSWEGYQGKVFRHGTSRAISSHLMRFWRYIR